MSPLFLTDGEDALALQLMRLDGRWWPSREFAALNGDFQYPYVRHYPPDIHVAYPSSDSPSFSTQKQAVLLLKTFPTACRAIEERCAVLRDFGATEYDDTKMCPDIPDSLEEGVAEGRRYEQLLRKMQDTNYLDQWLMSE
ncbi:hypothetical protein F4801DRAFT_585285 [Xylaria longipes]|nr:hypothetical protein F4801DRAFT_585285 [Xylaria longipes]